MIVSASLFGQTPVAATWWLMRGPQEKPGRRLSHRNSVKDPGPRRWRAFASVSVTVALVHGKVMGADLELWWWCAVHRTVTGPFLLNRLTTPTLDAGRHLQLHAARQPWQLSPYNLLAVCKARHSHTCASCFPQINCLQLNSGTTVLQCALHRCLLGSSACQDNLSTEVV